MGLALVQFGVAHLGFAGWTRRLLCLDRQGVSILGEFLGLVVLQVEATGHFATRVAFLFFRPNLEISATGTHAGSFRAHKGSLVERTAIQVAVALALRTRWALEVEICR